MLSLSPASSGVLLCLLFDREDGGDMSLRNFELYPNYVTLHETHIFIDTAVKTSNAHSNNSCVSFFFFNWLYSPWWV
jgi:hypothetical protein